MGKSGVRHMGEMGGWEKKKAVLLAVPRKVLRGRPDGVQHRMGRVGRLDQKKRT